MFKGSRYPQAKLLSFLYLSQALSVAHCFRPNVFAGGGRVWVRCLFITKVLIAVRIVRANEKIYSLYSTGFYAAVHPGAIGPRKLFCSLTVGAPEETV